MERCDVALNIFAKPYQTALSILSLLANCREQIQTIWLQFEPAGSRFDTTSPYAIAYYLRDELKVPCVIFQPEIWFDCDVAEYKRLHEDAYRLGLRFEYAMEHSPSRLLFLMHNDVFIQRNLLAAMIQEMGDAFAIGPLGQCWNCPASSTSLMAQALQRPPCRPESYATSQMPYKELSSIYALADSTKHYKRSYSDGLAECFQDQPWPLPECRINEWACLLDLTKTRPLTLPEGAALPVGAYAQCGSHTLDIGVAWFRAMHAHGLRAKHFATEGWLTHWVGTGHKSRLRYTQAEEHAKGLLQRFFPHYLTWLAQASPKM